ncbi:MAG: hypothetical protein SVR94_01285 [Pseudomonadota bacterium]|nr:hypothetical protein [Pseudomonadota bacterium]
MMKTAYWIMLTLAIYSTLALAQESLPRTIPAYLEPFYGETWTFTWNDEQEGSQEATITFDNTIATSPTTEFVSLPGSDNADRRWKMYYDGQHYILFHHYTEGDTDKQHQLKLQFTAATATGNYALFTFLDSQYTEQGSSSASGEFVSQFATCDQDSLQTQYDKGVAAGIVQCQNDPASCDIEVSENTDGSTEDGIAQCQQDPNTCGITFDEQAVIENNDDFQAGIRQCQRSPSACDIFVNPPVEATIAACQIEPSVCGIQVNWSESVEATRSACQASPAQCGIDCHCPPSVQGHYEAASGTLYLPQVDILIDAHQRLSYKVFMKQISPEPLCFCVDNYFALPPS